jgi:hypothetical protein
MSLKQPCHPAGDAIPGTPPKFSGPAKTTAFRRPPDVDAGETPRRNREFPLLSLARSQTGTKRLLVEPSFRQQRLSMDPRWLTKDLQHLWESRLKKRDPCGSRFGGGVSGSV